MAQMKLGLPTRAHTHKWRIVSVGSDLSRYFSDGLQPTPKAAAGDITIGKGCLMRVCIECGKREILRDVSFESGPAARE